MTDITELAQRLKAAADREMICRDVAETSEIWERTVTPENILALVEALASEKRICATWRKTAEANSETLEKAQQRIGKLEKKITDHKRMNQEMAKAMLTPNDSDAAGMEIAALRQRIAELESRTVKLPDELSGETLLDVASRTDLVYSDDTGVLEYTNINGCFVKVTAPPDKVIRFRFSNKGIYIRLVDRVKTHEHAGITIDFPKNYKDFIQ